MRKSTETRLYLAAFTAVSIITLIACSYGYGRTAELVSENKEVNTVIEQAIAEKDEAQERYDRLAHAAGEGAILESGIAFQEARQ